MNFKKIAVCCFLATGLLFPAISNNFDVNTIKAQSNITTLNSTQNSKTFSINNSNLANAMMSLLNKTKNEFNSNDLINSDDFKVIKTQTGSETDPESNEETPIFEYSANKTCLDLSNKNITDISELSQFVWPQTLTSIDLSNNNITSNHLENLDIFSSLVATTGEVDEETPIIYADIANYVDVINLNFNNISLTTLKQDFLDNDKFVFGFQKLSDEVHNKTHPTEYYIKSDHLNYFNLSATQNTLDIDLTLNEVSRLQSLGYGDYVINFSTKEDVNIASFNKTIKTSLFNIYTKDEFFVERKGYFEIKATDIVIEGLNEGYTIPANIKGSTKVAGTNSTNIEFTTNTKKWTSLVEYKVIDMHNPTIELIGGDTIYLQVNVDKYMEERAKGLDEGDDISDLIEITGSVDSKTAGTYYITYNLTDLSGRKAEPVTRKVVVQEYALGKPTLDTIEKEYFTGEEVTLTVSLPTGVDLSKYKKLTYNWYYNGNLFQTTTGDLKLSGKSSTPITELDSKNVEIFIMLVATLEDGSTESYPSNIINLEFKTKTKAVPTIIVSVIIALVLIIIAFVSVTIYNKRKSTHKKSTKKVTKKKSSKKKEDNKKGFSSNYENIQVIKDYKGNNSDDPPSTMQF